MLVSCSLNKDSNSSSINSEPSVTTPCSTCDSFCSTSLTIISCWSSVWFLQLSFSTSFLCLTDIRLVMVCSLRNLAELSHNFCMLAVACSGYSPIHLSFTLFINPLPLFLSSLSICTNLIFISIVHSTFLGCVSLSCASLLNGCPCTVSRPSLANLLALSIKFCAVLHFSGYSRFHRSFILLIKFFPFICSSLSISTTLFFSSSVQSLPFIV